MRNLRACRDAICVLGVVLAPGMASEADARVCEARFAAGVRLIAGVYPELASQRAIVVSFDTSRIAYQRWLDEGACEPGFIGVRVDALQAIHTHGIGQGPSDKREPPLASAVIQYSVDGKIVGIDMGESSARHLALEKDAAAKLEKSTPSAGNTSSVLAEAGARFGPSEAQALKQAVERFFASVVALLGPVTVDDVQFSGVVTDTIGGEERRTVVLLWRVTGEAAGDRVTALFEPFEGRLRSFRRGQAVAPVTAAPK
jgi:hypothetical protein